MKICWIGLGLMGLPMAGHLRAAGNDVTAFDLSETARAAAATHGIVAAGSLEAAAQDADLLVTMLPTGHHVRSVLLDPRLDDCAPGALALNCSTISPEEARDIARALSSQGRAFVDAPVSGGTTGAQDGTLTFMVGADTDQLSFLDPVLSAMGRRIVHVGDVGQGQAAKLVNNMMLAMNMAAVSEAAVLAEKLGLEAHTMWEIGQASSGDSWVLRNFYPVAGVVASSPASHDFAPGFTAALMNKDVALAIDELDAHGLRGTMTRTASTILQEMIGAGDGDLDFSAQVLLARTPLARSDR